jgi:hypothetical protein
VSEKGNTSRQVFPLMSYFRPIAESTWTAITEVTCKGKDIGRPLSG